MKSFLVYAVSALFVFLVYSFAEEFSPREVRDPNLRMALRAYGTNDINRTTNLALNGSGITDIRPLGRFTQLTRLELYNNRIADISPLSNLVRLTRLSLGKNRIRNINPLRALQNLETLELQKTEVRDLSPLADLPKLRELDIRDTSVMLESFSGWAFADALQIYDRTGKWFEVRSDEKDKWGLYAGVVVPYAPAPARTPAPGTNEPGSTRQPVTE